jgi:hypothetical protein
LRCCVLEKENYCSQTFVALDKWLNKAAAENGDEALKIVKENFQNNVKANLTYYEGLAEEAEKSGQKKLASKHRLLVSLYKELLG